MKWKFALFTIVSLFISDLAIADCKDQRKAMINLLEMCYDGVHRFAAYQKRVPIRGQATTWCSCIVSLLAWQKMVDDACMAHDVDYAKIYVVAAKDSEALRLCGKHP